MSSVPPQVSLNYPPTQCWQGPKETLSSVVHAWEWRECARVSVRVRARIPQNTAADSSTQTRHRRLHPTNRQYSHALQTLVHSPPLPFCQARAWKKKRKQGPQMRAQTAHTGLFFPSQLCSDIKQSPLRENKHADEERLAGHTARRCLRTHAGVQHAHTHVRPGRVWKFGSNWQLGDK